MTAAPVASQPAPALAPAAIRRLLDLAARHALRAIGRVEPNPLVGAALVRPTTDPLAPHLLALGHHRRFGDIHAEVDALNAARAAGHNPAGCTMLVTLEPCNHTGKQPPCTRALLQAGIAHVIIARADTNPVAAGGAETLRAAGIRVTFTSLSPAAHALADPFYKRVTSDQPWVIAKWAQSLDGALAAASGDSKWISSPASRFRVHHLRSVVDAVLVGVGTVIADDPALTARDVPLRRRPLRVILDPRARTPDSAALITTARQHPTLLLADPAHLPAARAAALAAAGVTIDWPAPDTITARGLPRACLALLRARHNVHTLLVEGGPRTHAAFLADNLVDELHVFTAPLLLGAHTHAPALPAPPATVAAAHRWRLLRTRSLGNDLWSIYRR